MENKKTDTKNTEIKEVWQKFLYGDDKAFDKLYDTYVQILFRFGLRYTYDRELIKDCIQDVFINMYEKRTQLHDVENIEIYLRIALKNRLINSANRDKIHSKYLETLEPEDFILDESTDSYDEEESKKKFVEYILTLLTPQQQKAVIHRYIEEKSIKETAELLNVNYQSVQNILQRALKKIKNYFK